MHLTPENVHMSKKKNKSLQKKKITHPQNQQQVKTSIVAQYSGPLPPPESLASYDEISPGFANRIIAMAESEMDHRHELEKRALTGDIWEARIGQFFGFLIGMGTVIAGTITAINGAQWAGGFIGTTGVIGLVSVFIYGRKKQQNVEPS